MRELARGVGLLSLTSGALLLIFPETARSLMLARAELAQLSPGALRLLGGWVLLTGALLVSTTAKPLATTRVGEGVESELRKAA